MIQRFRKKPVVIEAYLFTGTEASMNGLVDWISSHGAMFSRWGENHCRIGIRTLEGLMEVSSGDYVIRGVKGEFYPCKPDIFAATYEAEDVG